MEQLNGWKLEREQMLVQQVAHETPWPKLGILEQAIVDRAMQDMAEAADAAELITCYKRDFLVHDRLGIEQQMDEIGRLAFVWAIRKSGTQLIRCDDPNGLVLAQAVDRSGQARAIFTYDSERLSDRLVASGFGSVAQALVEHRLDTAY